MIGMSEIKNKKNVKNADAALVKKYQQMVQFVKNVLSDVDSDLKRAKLILSKLERFDPSNLSSLDTDSQTEEAI
jgi:hypothetical protein